MIMHIGSTEEITLLKFNEEEEGDQQEIPQATAPKEEEQTLEELLECPDHRPTSFLKGKPRSILSLTVFYKILFESFMIDALGYKNCLETLDAWNYLVSIYTPSISYLGVVLEARPAAAKEVVHDNEDDFGRDYPWLGTCAARSHGRPFVWSPRH